MNDQEILNLWKKGLNKNKVAQIYMRQQNQRIKIIRYDRKHRHEKLMTYYEALYKVERVILKEIKKNEDNRFIK